MKIKLFVTGTDTGVGKTYISCALLKALAKKGCSTIGMKPVASGCELSVNGLVNQDALDIQQAMSLKQDYSKINPFALQTATAPHIAADIEKKILSIASLVQKTRELEILDADALVIEGAGGWQAPLNNAECMSDYAACLTMPVILVVSIKLGCINHALLTIAAIKNKNIPIIGWVANCLDTDMLALTENIDTLKHWITEPCLGVIKKNQKAEKFLDIETIINYF